MYLTRMQLNPARREARKLLGSPRAMHAAVEAAFPQPVSPGHGRNLWRLDEDKSAVWLYIQSPTRPDLSHVVEQAGWPTTSTWQTRELTPLLDSLHPGSRWGFRLTANPTRSGRPASGGDTQRFGHVTAAQQLQWLLDRTEKNGFLIPPVGSAEEGEHAAVVTRRDRTTFRHEDGNTARQVTLTRATFTGLLDVIDADILRAAILRGIGPGKAYGCGLLTLAPAP